MNCKSPVHVSSFRRRFTLLLISIVILLLFHPFVPGEGIGVRGIDIFLMSILLAGIYAVSDRKSLLYVALLVGMTAFVTGILIYFIKTPIILLIMYLSFALFFLMVISAILSHLLRAEEVTADIIFGSICVYLLIGVLWAMIFSVIEIIKPGSFFLRWKYLEPMAAGF